VIIIQRIYHCPSKNKCEKWRTAAGNIVFIPPFSPTMTKTRSLQLDATSIALGWCYCILWSFSFYPQIILNYRRKSVVGFSLDFALFNFLGFLCYTIYTCSLKWNPAVREQYFTVYKTNLVTLEDCLFALHGLLMCALTCYQCIFYERAGKRNSNACLIAASIITMCCIGYLIAVISSGGNGGPVFFEADSEKKSNVNLFFVVVFCLSHTVQFLRPHIHHVYHRLCFHVCK
jgi:uncharacterized protein with PQ loop repeat